MDWIKIMCNILDHRKIRMIRKGPEGNTLVLLWLLILVEAGKCNRGGYLMISDTVPYTDETISMITDIPLTTVRLGLSIFGQLGMIDRQDDNVIYIKNWRRYQSADKLEERRRKDRLRQQRHRERQRRKILGVPEEQQKVSRDRHVNMSRDVTLQNRQEKNRVEKTTTEQIRSLISETPFEKISERDLLGLKNRHGAERLLTAADLAVQAWRRNPKERRNPAGYLNSLCVSLIIPEWYIPFRERQQLAEKKKFLIEEQESAAKERLDREREKQAVIDDRWMKLPEEKRDEYIEKVRSGLPPCINPPEAIIEIMAKGIAGRTQS